MDGIAAEVMCIVGCSLFLGALFMQEVQELIESLKEENWNPRQRRRR